VPFFVNKEVGTKYSSTEGMPPLNIVFLLQECHDKVTCDIN